MKLRMIIADDEYNVREGLREVVPWGEMGIEVIAVAADGPEALELCRSLKPDILLTDIRMPMLDGLEAANQLRQSNSPIRIIIISGVQDFNYAKTALNLNADGYILKPVKLNELQDVVGKAAASIRAERSREESERKLQAQLKENMPALKEKFLSNLILGMYRDNGDLTDKLGFFGLSLHHAYALRVAVLQIDDYEQAVERYSEENKQLIAFSVNNILEEILAAHKAGITFNPNENRFIVVFQHTSADDHRYEQMIQDMVDSASTYLKLTLSVGIGNSVRKATEVQYSYREAEEAIGYKFFTGKGSILHISDFDRKRLHMEYVSIYEEQNKLISFMKLGKSEEVDQCLMRLFDQLSRDRNCPIAYVQSIGVELVNMASKAFHEWGERLDAVIPDMTAVIADIYNQDNIADLIARLQALFGEITTFFLHKNNQKNSGTIKRIKNIIQQRYMENLTVGRLSEEVYLSPNYISLIFKQETGTTITEYMTGIRMEAAKELLKSPDLKVLEVAEMIGYENATYFSTVFKKYTGMHPQKYRSLFFGDA